MSVRSRIISVFGFAKPIKAKILSTFGYVSYREIFGSGDLRLGPLQSQAQAQRINPGAVGNGKIIIVNATVSGPICVSAILSNVINVDAVLTSETYIEGNTNYGGTQWRKN